MEEEFVSEPCRALGVLHGDPADALCGRARTDESAFQGKCALVSGLDADLERCPVELAPGQAEEWAGAVQDCFQCFFGPAEVRQAQGLAFCRLRNA